MECEGHGHKWSINNKLAYFRTASVKKLFRNCGKLKHDFTNEITDYRQSKAIRYRVSMISYCKATLNLPFSVMQFKKDVSKMDQAYGK